MEAQRQEVERELAVLAERRDATLDELDRLRELIDNVTSHLRARAEAEAPASVTVLPHPTSEPAAAEILMGDETREWEPSTPLFDA